MTQTHTISGLTSQWPSNRTPPHGPFRKFLGQFIGQTRPVECSTHWPHMWQPQIGTLMTCSTGRKTRSNTPVKRKCLSKNRRTGSSVDISPKLHLRNDRLANRFFSRRAGQLLTAIDKNAIGDAIAFERLGREQLLSQNDPVSKLADNVKHQHLS